MLFYQSINDPFKKEVSKKESEVKMSNKPSDKRISTAVKMTNKYVLEKIYFKSRALALFL